MWCDSLDYSIATFQDSFDNVRVVKIAPQAKCCCPILVA